MWEGLVNFVAQTVKGIRSESGTEPAAVGLPAESMCIDNDRCVCNQACWKH